jgi:hypothetical protein
VYDSLSEQLGDSFYVFYSSPWLGTKPDGEEVDGEADFVIAHPLHGMLTVEVKGGRITIGSDQQWRSTDRDGITHKIKNPVKQAHDSKHALLEKLKESPLWKPRWITIRHGVILPSTAPESRDFRPNMPLKLFAFDDDMNALEEWVLNRFAAAEEDDPTSGEDIGYDGCRALQDLITRPIQMRVRLQTHIDEDLHEIKLLSDDQIWVLRDLENNKRMAIAGAAGTGKTILALQKAITLAEKGKSVLLLCFNAPLGGYLNHAVANYETVTVAYFHGYCRTVFEEAAARSGKPLWDIDSLNESEIAEALLEAAVETGRSGYDAIIIDEGQDFSDEWLEALEMVVKGGDEGILYVFYDNNQRVMSRGREYLSTLPVARYRLSRNFRNTKYIFRAAHSFYDGDFVRPVGPQGTAVEFVAAESLEETRTKLAEQIGNLINNENVEPDEIAVLAPDVVTCDKLAPKGRIGRYATSDAGRKMEGTITLESVRRFKGLESPVVLLVLKAERRIDEELLYTGMTRAQSMLFVIGPAKTIGSLQNVK